MFTKTRHLITTIAVFLSLSLAVDAQNDTVRTIQRLKMR